MGSAPAAVVAEGRGPMGRHALVALAARSLRRASSAPRPSAVSAVPFSVSRAEADAAFAAHHTAHALLPRAAPKVDAVTPVLVPFWSVAASGSVRVTRASLGFDRYERVWDAAARRWRSELRTVWRGIELNGRRHGLEVSPADPGAQVVATLRWSRPDADAVRPGAAISRAGSVADAVAGAPGGPASVAAFDLPPRDGVALALARARAAAADAIGAGLRHEFRADRVAGVELEVDVGRLGREEKKKRWGFGRARSPSVSHTPLLLSQTKSPRPRSMRRRTRTTGTTLARG